MTTGLGHKSPSEVYTALPQRLPSPLTTITHPALFFFLTLNYILDLKKKTKQLTECFPFCLLKGLLDEIEWYSELACDVFRDFIGVVT